MRRTRKFAMHESTRRLVCRAAFLLLCLLPTAGVTVWVGISRSSAYQRMQLAGWQRELSRQWGLTVTLGAVTQPRRGVTLLDGVRVSDPETAALIAEIRQVEVGWHAGRRLVIAAQPEVQGDQLGRLWMAFHEQFMRGSATVELPVHVQAGDLTIHRDDRARSTTMTDVRCRLDNTSEGPQASFEFRDVALKMAEPARVRVTRNRQLSPPATRWELDTRGTPLPCAMLAAHFPALRQLGIEATFQGNVEITQASDGWHGELAGRFRAVDLDQLVSQRYDHRLTGMAEVLLRRARFQDGKLSDAAGDLSSLGGVVSRSLLAQADKMLGVVADTRVRALEADMLWLYRELRFGFEITADGLRIVGHCQHPSEGVVMTDQYGPLLTDQPQEIAQVIALVQTLTTSTGEQVPATAEAYQLLHVLPIPSRNHQRTPVAAPAVWYSPLRMQ
jgi:hypothetical protein